jgi:hypothetical protein
MEGSAVEVYLAERFEPLQAVLANTAIRTRQLLGREGGGCGLLLIWVEDREIYSLQEAIDTKIEDSFRTDEMRQAFESRPLSRQGLTLQQIGG